MPVNLDLFVFFIAIFPLLTFFLLVLLARFTLFLSSLYAFILMLFVSAFFWHMPIKVFVAAFIKSFFSTFEIVFILFGALTLISILDYTGLFKTVKLTISKSSKDKVISMLVIAWFFVSFIEGIAGFGLPAVLSAPLLISLGLSPITSIIISLLGDSVAVSFGAVGVPINKGILLTVPSGQIAEYLNIPINQLARQIALKNALYHIFISSFVPIIMVFFILKDLKKPFIEFKKYLIPSIISGISLTFLMYFTIYFLDASLASIISPLLSLFVFILIYERDFFINLFKNNIVELNRKKVFLSFLPYVLLVVILSFQKIFSIDFFKSYALLSLQEFKNVELNLQFNPLFSPGFAFLIVGIFLYFYLGKNFGLKRLFDESFHKIKKIFITLFLIISLTQLMVYSKYGYFFNSSNNSILDVTSSNIFYFVSLISNKIPYGHFLNYFLPGFLGLMGASLAGSATVSNILFSNISLSALEDPINSLALQNIGASLGNLISLYNILIVSSVVGFFNKEFKILKITFFLAVFFYLLSVIFFIFAM